MKLRIAALAALALLATPIAHRIDRELRGTYTVGEVTDLTTHGSQDGTTYEPEISFLHDGQRVVLHGLSISPPMYSVGERIDILYDGDDAVFGSPLARWWPWALAVATCLAVFFQVRIPPRFRTQLFGIAVVAGFVVVGSPDRAQARGCICIAATALAAVVVIALRQVACRRCVDECRCDDVQIARAIARKRRSSTTPATLS